MPAPPGAPDAWSGLEKPSRPDLKFTLPITTGSDINGILHPVTIPADQRVRVRAR